MEKFRSRCHFSIIFQSIWQFWAIILVFLLSQLDSIVLKLKDLSLEDAPMEGLISLLIIVAISIVIFVFQFLRWRKTWIIVKDNLIIYEKNTLNKVKKTIALENVSTVNIERNLFDRMVGTSRIKMDTNSMTTAKSTDINILLKEDKALEFKELVMSLIDADSDSVKPLFDANSEKQTAIFETDATDLFKHWLYTLPIVSTLIVVIGIVWAVAYTLTYSFDNFIVELLGSFLAFALVVVGAFFNVLKQFLGYFNFTIYRENNDIHVKRGLIKLREYVIPLTKINAISIEQPPIARFCRKYTVKVNTVGIGDDEDESAFLCLAMSKEKMLEQMSLILPEYSFEEMLDVVPEEKVGMKVRLFLSIKWHVLFLGVVSFILFLDFVPNLAIAFPIALDLYANLLYLLSHRAAGYAFCEKGVTFSNGYFARHYTLCSYGKMEYVSLDTHPAAKLCNVYKGTLYMLNHMVEIPYIHRDLAQKITSQMVSTKRLV